MNDVNFIKSQLESWRSCMNWINVVYHEKMFELEHELKNEKAISYEDKQGGTTLNESMRRSMVIDKMNELDKFKTHCETVIEFCESLMSKVRPQYKDVFEYRYWSCATISWIGYQTGFEEDTIYKICDRETERIANE